MPETRSAGNDEARPIAPEVQAEIEKGMVLSESQVMIQGLNTAVESIPPEAQKLSDFLEAEIFNRYQIPEQAKIELVKRWHEDELNTQFFLDEPEYDITSEGVAYFESEIQQTYEVRQDQEESITNSTFLYQLKTLQKENNWSNTELINYALESGQIPESQVGKFERFKVLLDPETISNEVDRGVIQQAVNGLDIAALPDPVLFVQHSIYGNESISEETKIEIEQKLHIPRAINVETASDALNLLEEGSVDSEGKRQELTKENPAVIDNYTYLYTAPNGDGVMDMIAPDGRQFVIRFDKASGVEAIGNRMFTLRTIMAAESLALAQPIFQRGYQITHGGVMDIHFDDVIRAKRVAQSLLGDTTGFDGKILSESEINRLKHQYQAFRKEGDWATGDNDPTRAQQDFQELGIVSESGELNWTQFDRACRFVQQQTSQGAVPEFETLKTFLNQVVPSQ